MTGDKWPVGMRQVAGVRGSMLKRQVKSSQASSVKRWIAQDSTARHSSRRAKEVSEEEKREKKKRREEFGGKYVSEVDEGSSELRLAVW